MFEILKSDKDFERHLGEEVFVRFEVDPKVLTCCGNVKEFLQECAEKSNELKDGFYKLICDSDDRTDYHRFTIKNVNDGDWSARHNFIKEIYGMRTQWRPSKDELDDMK